MREWTACSPQTLLGWVGPRPECTVHGTSDGSYLEAHYFLWGLPENTTVD